jgi:Flp pilus assembly protein TadD
MAEFKRTEKVEELFDQAMGLRMGNKFNGIAPDYTKAISLYNEVIKLMPDDWESYGDRGVCYRELGQEENAIADINKAISLNPQVSYLYSDRGITYFQLGETEKAEADIEKAAELNTKCPNVVYFAFAEKIEKLTGNKRDAAKYLKKVIERGGAYADDSKALLAKWGM